MQTDGTVHVETLIIGGGQAGLAVGYHLTRQQQSVLILEAHERIGDSWRGRWDSLRVFTPARYDGLPGWAFPAPGWSYPTKDEVADYLEEYAVRFRLPVRTGVRVDGLARSGGRYVVTCGPDRVEADNVVVATGGYQVPRIPSYASALDPDILQLHSNAYRNPSELREGGVLVVGAGNSGAEIAREVARHHPTWLSGRDTGQEPVRAGGLTDRILTPPFWFLLTHVLTLRTPMGRKARDHLTGRGLPLARVRRRDLLRAGVERVPRTAGALEGLPLLADGRALEVANVIWCTGFRHDFTWIDLPVFDPGGDPVHDRGVVPSEPGLYFVGLFFLYAGSSPLIGGVGRDARHIARHITRRRTQDGRARRLALEAGQQVPG